MSAFTVAPLPKIKQFLLIARLLGDKGVREYVKAASKVRQRYPDLRFGLVGWIDGILMQLVKMNCSNGLKRVM